MAFFGSAVYTAVLAPVLIGIYELSTAAGRVRARIGSAVRDVVPYGVEGGIFWVIRIYALRGFAGAGQYAIRIGPTIWTGPRAVLWDLGKQLWPGKLSVAHPVVVVEQLVMDKEMVKKTLSLDMKPCAPVLTSSLSNMTLFSSPSLLTNVVSFS